MFSGAKVTLSHKLLAEIVTFFSFSGIRVPLFKKEARAANSLQTLCALCSTFDFTKKRLLKVYNFLFSSQKKSTHKLICTFWLLACFLAELWSCTVFTIIEANCYYTILLRWWLYRCLLACNLLNGLNAATENGHTQFSSHFLYNTRCWKNKNLHLHYHLSVKKLISRNFC